MNDKKEIPAVVRCKNCGDAISLRTSVMGGNNHYYHVWADFGELVYGEFCLVSSWERHNGEKVNYTAETISRAEP